MNRELKDKLFFIFRDAINWKYLSCCSESETRIWWDGRLTEMDIIVSRPIGRRRSHVGYVRICEPIYNGIGDPRFLMVPEELAMKIVVLGALP